VGNGAVGDHAEVNIRLAKVEDSAGIAKVQIDSYRIGYRGLVPDHFYAHMTIEEQTQDWIDILSKANPNPLYVAVDDENHVLGYALGRLLTDEKFDCELSALHILKDHQRQGHGTALMSAIAKHYTDAGHTSLVLWTIKGNSARAMYEKLGGKLAGEKTYSLDADTELTEVAYGWQDMKILIR
jgi:ribosomal protein S18 acetylase RimI-like enzyme